MTTIRTQAFRRIEADTTGFEVTCTASGVKMPVALNPDERRALAAALTADQGGQWTREDLPSVRDLVKASVDATAIDPSGGADAALGAVVSHLNAHHPKPSEETYVRVLDQSAEINDLKADRDEWKARALDAEHYAQDVSASNRDNADRASKAERERDAAVERAEQAENARDTAATRAAQLEKEVGKWRTSTESAHSDFLQAAHERDEWKARAEAAEKRTAPLDPVVLVVGESDLEACQVRRRPESSPYGGAGSWEAADQTWLYSEGVTVETLDEEIEVNLRGVIQALAVRRAIEAEAVVDPVEAKARKIAKGVGWSWDGLDGEYVEILRSVARFVIGQETSSDE